MIFLEQLKDDSAFPLAWADDWPFSRKLAVATLNELRILRAEANVHAGGEYQEPQLIKTPNQQLAEQLDAEEKKKIRLGIMAQLNQGV